MLEAQTLSEEARQVKLYLLKINFPSYHAKKLKLSFFFFFPMEIASAIEQQIGPIEKGKEVITVGDRQV